MNTAPHPSQTANKVSDTPPNPFSVTVDSESATAHLADRIARHLKPSDVVLLDGGLAAGKTFFVRSLVESIGTDDQVSSPTYAIANIYQTNTFDVLHVDAYRLAGPQEFYLLGLDTQLEESICLIEWGSRIQPAFDQYLQISISFRDGQDTARRFDISNVGQRWAPVMADLRKEFQEQ